MVFDMKKFEKEFMKLVGIVFFCFLFLSNMFMFGIIFYAALSSGSVDVSRILLFFCLVMVFNIVLVTGLFIKRVRAKD